MKLSTSKRRAIVLAIGGAELFLSQFQLPEIVEVLRSTTVPSVLGLLAKDSTLVDVKKDGKASMDKD